MRPTLAVIIPSYGHFNYVRKAVVSALENTRATEATVLLIDDASPGGDDELKRIYYDFARHRSRLILHRFSENGGLTRSWNLGLKMAKDKGFHYACCANSDLIFPLGWDISLNAVLEEGKYSLAGPITNAPGSEKTQDVNNYCKHYVLTDEEQYLDSLSLSLHHQYIDHAVPATLNGFCMMAKVDTWWDYAYEAAHVFCPRNDFNSRGQRNPTPLMTLNEYELQRRWHDLGLKSALVPGSFVWHYRSVSRGDRHKSPGWYRAKT